MMRRISMVARDELVAAVADRYARGAVARAEINEATGTRVVRQRSKSGKHSPVRQYGFSSCLPRSIRVREGGQARRITKQRALIKSLTAQALKGDARGNERTACD